MVVMEMVVVEEPRLGSVDGEFKGKLGGGEEPKQSKLVRSPR
jgi:hypothetical protein